MIAPEIDYSMRRKFEAAGLARDLAWGKSGAYLAAWVEARQAGRKISVSEACEQAGFSTDSLRQRRKHNATFRAGERWARFGEPYTPPVTEQPQNVVVTDPEAPTEHGPGRPLAPGESPDVALPIPSWAGMKLRPTRRFTPQWVPGSGYEHY